MRVSFKNSGHNVYGLAARCKKLGVIALFAVFLTIPASLYAIETPLSSLQTPHVYKETVDALKTISKGRWKEGSEMIAETKDPLAAKIYYWLLFTRSAEEEGFLRLANFIRQNPEWPDIRSLRIKAEKSLSDASKSADIIAWFDDYPPLTAHGFDMYINALLGNGKTDKVRKLLAAWWAKTPLSREDQKALYQKYKAYIGKKAHIKRLDMLLFSGQYTNARAIARVLEGGYPALTEARIALAEQTGNVTALINRVPPNLKRDPGLLYERLRWRRRHDLDFAAMEILHDMPAQNEIQNPDEWWLERHIIIRRLLEQKRYDSAYLLASEHGQKQGLAYAQAEWLTGFLALRYQKRPATAFEHFQLLFTKVETPISRSRAAYWAGEAAKQLGQDEMAKHWVQKAAQYQSSYYGQLASEELQQQGYLPRIAPPSLTLSDKEHFNTMELVQAARLFHSADMREEATRFIQAFINTQESPQAYRFGAELAAELGHYHDAIRIAKKATQKGLFLTVQSYPIITDQLKGVKVEWALVHALIRQESMFDFKARSPSGALGLMQVMPATAREVAKKSGLRHETSWLTAKPSHNIRIGTTYLQRMIDRYDGSYILAVAAYNAGPNRVDEWLKTFGDPRKGDVNVVDWVELIPVYETRNYVQRVMEGLYIYRLRLKNK